MNLNNELTQIVLELKKEFKDDEVINRLIQLADKSIKLNQEQLILIQGKDELIEHISNIFLSVKKEKDCLRKTLEHLIVKG